MTALKQRVSVLFYIAQPILCRMQLALCKYSLLLIVNGYVTKSLLNLNAEFPRDPWVSSWEEGDEMREGDRTKKDEGGAYERHL